MCLVCASTISNGAMFTRTVCVCCPQYVKDRWSQCTGVHATQTKHLLGADNVRRCYHPVCTDQPVVYISILKTPGAMCGIYSQCFFVFLEFNSVHELPCVTSMCQQMLIFSDIRQEPKLCVYCNHSYTLVLV